jgi:hypothetical protein
VVESLHGKPEALSSTPRTAKKFKIKREDFEETEKEITIKEIRSYIHIQTLKRTVF